MIWIWLTVALFLFIFQIASILVLEFRNPPKAMAWMFILFAVPIIGFVLYYFLAQDYKRRSGLRRRGTRLIEEVKQGLPEHIQQVRSPGDIRNPDFANQERLFRFLTRLGDNPITSRNETLVLSKGELAFAALLQEMEQATHHIHIQFYIYRDDVIGTQFQKIMVRKAKEGVKVRLMCDGLGSLHLGRKYIRELREAGVDVHFFLPALKAVKSKRLNYRNHRKMMVVDGTVGFIGGLNVGDDYLGLYEKTGYWRDTVLQIKGDAVYSLQTTFIGDWYMVSGESINASEMYPQHDCNQSEQVQIITSGPDQQGDAIQEISFGAFTVAKKRIWIATPYFIPDLATYTALKTAALSGIEVIVIIPYHSDNRLVKMATLSYAAELMKAGVKFYQYTKGFIHAKVIIVDHLIASLGTANLDMRSFYSNFEMTALLYGSATIERLYQDFEEDLQQSIYLDPEEFMNRSRRQRAGELIARMLSPLL